MSSILVVGPSVGLGVQASELVVAVLLDARRAAYLATRRDGDGARRDHDDVADVQSMRVGDRGRNVASDAAEPVQEILAGLAALLDRKSVV